jgi:hypothetical protein
MRTFSDLIDVQVVMSRKLILDFERIELDPIWAHIALQHGIEPGEQPSKEAIHSYVMHYISRDQFPHQIPATNGPGDITAVQMEVSCPAQSSRQPHP